MYIFDMTTTVVVVADSPCHAEQVANEHRDEIVRDIEGMRCGVPREVTDLSMLRDDWSGDCLPYGGDGDTRIADLIGHNASAKGRE